VLRQQNRFCTTSDGVRLSYATFMPLWRLSGRRA